MAKIIYTHTDEAPMLATYSFLPIVEAFASTAGVEVETRDISLAGRIIAAFGDYLTEEQRVSDALAELGALAKKPEANIIKLPNISASTPQLKAAIAELQGQGYALPDYPDNPSSDEETDIRSRYDKIKGSAVNPVLREGNSDRRAPLSVKNYARQNPHSMGAWTPESKTNVATMDADDFRSNEKSVVIEADGNLKIQLVKEDGTVKVLKRAFPVLAGEVIDGTVMRAAALDDVPRRPGCPRQGRGRAVLRPPQGHHDEGLGPDHLRPRRQGVLRRALRHLRRPDRRRRPEPEQRPRLHPQRPRGPPRGDPRRRRGRHPEGPRTTAPSWPWSIPTRASPTCTSPPT